MDNNIEATDSTPVEETTSNPVAPVVPQTDPELVKKNQELFARAKKAEEELKELRTLKTGESTFDSAKLKNEIEERVDLRMKGYSPEHIQEIERYAKGAGISLTEAEKSPFIQNAVEALRAKENTVENTPAPSSKIKVFNGKPVEQIFKEGTPEEKQAAFMAKLKGGVKSNE